MIANERTEYMLEALVLARGEPSTEATWESWGGPFESLDDPLAESRMNFLRNTKEASLSGQREYARNRILDYRILKRTVTTTEWEEV